ncbi:MAG: acyl-CoA dehydrogenase family protein [Myxococcota bacterium]|nr:acyl-CoA dehydrogenase family protein [Myxococcota bacterium]
MDFDFSPEDEAFREEVRAFLVRHLPPAEERGPDFMQRWLRAVREKRYVGFSWPEEVTGGGGSLERQYILKEEMTKARAPMLGIDVTGLAWVGPAIIQWGSEEQKRQFIPDILDSKSAWCTGYSEPDVGSDLASLQCRGVREGDEYVVTGQKIWTSLAHYAKWIYMMVRTELDTPSRYTGITCLLVPMTTPGIEVQPIRNMAGGHMFNQVFFSDVRVPVENRLGEEGQGWDILMSALQNERSGLVEVMGAQRNLDGLVDLAKRSRRNGRSAAEDSRVRRRLAVIETKIEALRLNGLRALTQQLEGGAHQSQSSINKLLMSELLVEIHDFSMELQGQRHQYMPGSEEVVDEGRWQAGSLSWPTTVVGGGTPNVQKNIIAERMLGLPKD